MELSSPPCPPPSLHPNPPRLPRGPSGEGTRSFTHQEAHTHSSDLFCVAVLNKILAPQHLNVCVCVLFSVVNQTQDTLGQNNELVYDLKVLNRKIQ